jgi:hypothetical protein
MLVEEAVLEVTLAVKVQVVQAVAEMALKEVMAFRVQLTQVVEAVVETLVAVQDKVVAVPVVSEQVLVHQVVEVQQNLLLLY